MRIRKILPIIFILLAGCTSLPADKPGATGNQPGNATAAQSQAGSATELSGQKSTQPEAQTTKPADATQPGSHKGAFPGGAPLALTIDSPKDQDVVAVPNLDIKGKVSRDAVLSLNDNTYLIPAGSFSKPITLAEGPNAIQIVASDTSGNEVDLILTVTYQP